MFIVNCLDLPYDSGGIIQLHGTSLSSHVLAVHHDYYGEGYSNQNDQINQNWVKVQQNDMQINYSACHSFAEVTLI